MCTTRLFASALALNVGVAKEFAATFRGASMHLLDADHWVVFVEGDTDPLVCVLGQDGHGAPDFLAIHLGVMRSQLDAMAITDPRRAVAIDVATYKANQDIPGGFMISDLSMT